MTEALKLSLPYPPSVNQIWENKGGGQKGRYLSKRGKAYRTEVQVRTLEQHGLFKPFTGPVSVSVELFPPDKRKRDIDNGCKALFDSMKHANVYMDDSQIKQLTIIMREPSKENAGCTVIVEEQ